MAGTETARLAVLIDADNASASIVKELLEEVAKYGTATVKRAYGDWTTQNLVGWKEHLRLHAIQPMQQFAYTRGKNSTDSAFIIDAMDLLYADNVDERTDAQTDVPGGQGNDGRVRGRPPVGASPLNRRTTLRGTPQCVV